MSALDKRSMCNDLKEHRVRIPSIFKFPMLELLRACCSGVPGSYLKRRNMNIGLSCAIEVCMLIQRY